MHEERMIDQVRWGSEDTDSEEEEYIESRF